MANGSRRHWNEPIDIPSTVAVIVGTALFGGAAVTAGIPAVKNALGGPTVSIGIVGSYLILTLLAGLGVAAALLSWVHERGPFTSVSVLMWPMTLVTLAFFPPVGIGFVLLAAGGSLMFFEAERSGAAGLGFSFGHAGPEQGPSVDFVPGGNLSRTRTGLIEEYRRKTADPWNEQALERVEQFTGGPESNVSTNAQRSDGSLHRSRFSILVDDTGGGQAEDWPVPPKPH